MFLRKSANITVMLGPILTDGNGHAINSGLTITQAQSMLSKVGAAFAQKTSPSSATHGTGGMYPILLDITDTNTVGSLVLNVDVTGARSTTLYMTVLDAAIYDALFGSAANGFNSLGQVTPSGAYALASVWVNTVDGTAGSVVNTNGTTDNQVDNITDVLLLTAALNLTTIQISNNSVLTFSTAISNLAFRGLGWSLTLSSAVLTNVHIHGATVGGSVTGVGNVFVDCTLSNVVIPPCEIRNCGIDLGIIATGAGSYYISDSRSRVSGQSTYDFNFANISGINLNYRHHSGGITVKNMVTGDTLSYEGNGQLIIDASCTGGIIAYRGNIKLTDNVLGGFASIGTLVTDDNTDTLKTIKAKLPVGSISDFDETINTVNVGKISGSQIASVNLSKALETTVRGKVTNSGNATPTEFDTDLTETTIDHYKNLVLKFGTGLLATKGTTIVSSSATGRLTVVGLGESPDDGDEFIIV